MYVCRRVFRDKGTEEKKINIDLVYVNYDHVKITELAHNKINW
jgi:hypothetical protein